MVHIMLDLSTIKACSEVNPSIDEGKLIIVKGKPTFSIPDLGVTFTSHEAIQSLLRNGAKKVLSAYTASQKTRINAAIIETVEVWREDKPYLTVGEKEKANKVTVPTGTGKTFKLPFGRMLIEGKLRDILGPDDVRVKKIESLNDDLFVALIEAKGGEGYLSQAIAELAMEAKRKLEAEKASLLAEFGDLGL